MTRQTRHLTDSRLLLLIEEGGRDAHLDACPACRARLEDWRALPAAAETAADEAFARAFPDTRLAASRRRILEAIDAHRVGRVVPFPGVDPRSPAAPPAPSAAARRYPRWMTGAAAGLILGLVLGRWTHPAHQAPPAAPAQSRVVAHVPVSRPAVEPVAYPLPSDDEFLRDLETLRSGPVAAVRTLHELTPQADAHDTLW